MNSGLQLLLVQEMRFHCDMGRSVVQCNAMHSTDTWNNGTQSHSLSLSIISHFIVHGSNSFSLCCTHATIFECNPMYWIVLHVVKHYGLIHSVWVACNESVSLSRRIVQRTRTQRLRPKQFKCTHSWASLS